MQGAGARVVTIGRFLKCSSFYRSGQEVCRHSTDRFRVFGHIFHKSHGSELAVQRRFVGEPKALGTRGRILVECVCCSVPVTEEPQGGEQNAAATNYDMRIDEVAPTLTVVILI